jgi:PIN domain nuclease of toxin-antitoxin system
MVKKPYVLDSWAMLAFFQNEPSAGRVEKIINEAHATGADLMMSVIAVLKAANIYLLGRI